MSDERFTNDAVRDVLARAIDIDHARSDTVSLSQLESIAAELGISRAAVVTALMERRRITRDGGSPFRMRLVTATWAAIGGATTLGMAVIYSGTQLPVFTLALTGWIGISIGLATFTRSRLHRLFLVRNAGFWLGVAGVQLTSVLWDGTLGDAMSIVVIPNALLWLVTSAAGAATLELRNWRRQRLTASGRASAGRWREAKARVRVKLKAWIDHVLSRSHEHAPPSPGHVMTSRCS
jgi:hypothetical protein